MKHIAWCLVVLTLALSCREPFEIENSSFEDVLVVESTITNELKQQIVKVSRTYNLEENEPAFENNATVWIEDNLNTIFSFSQNTTGDYVSDIEFNAETGHSYTLYITTQDGKEFSSTETSLSPISEITQLYAELITRDNGDIGIEVLVDSNNENSEAKYFRYEYEETYEVRPPHHSGVEGIIDFTQEPTVIVTPRLQEEGLCYTTESSFGVIQTTSENLENNNVIRFPIRFIEKSNGIIRDRYSILVTQYVQNIEAYTFYKIIEELGSIESILSETQPGNVSGNLQSLDNENEKVVGYFDVATVNSQRIYFTYSDFNIVKPPYIYDCELLDLDYTDNTSLDGDRNDRFNLEQRLLHGLYKLVSANHPNYVIATTECTDCTSISSNIRPDWWED